ncbi:CHAT domain-containing protein [Kribbella sp. NPDC049174]|uniref:CHAT domain-containing tetratricopeptide repeat protein n=1 Tax=Kribbella sp. NPDC049174 TaxID=3364112 RepID=UPI00370FE2F9
MGSRDDLIEQLGEVLSRIRETLDPSPALAPVVVAVAADLARSLDERHSLDVEARYVLGWLTWHQAEALPDWQQQSAIDNALELLSPAASLIGQLGFPEQLLPALGELAMPELTAMVEHARASRDTALLTEAIVRCGHVLEAAPATQPEIARRMSFLGVALLTRFQQTGDTEDIDNAVAAVRRAVELGDGDRNIDMYLSNLCAILKTRHEHTHDARDLDEAIALGRRSVAVATADKLAGMLSNLSAVLLMRFDLTSSPDDLAEATDAARRAVATAHTADPNRPAMLNNLARALHQGFTLGGPAADLDEAVRAGRLAVQAGEGQLDAEMFLSNLEAVLRSRFDLSGRAEDLDEAIVAARRLVSLTRVSSPVQAGRLIRLGSALLARYGKTHVAADLDEAIAVSRRAAAGPADDPGRVSAVELLDRGLSARFESSGVPGDQDEAIAARRTIVEATLAGAPERSERLSGVAFALLDRFHRRKDPRDLDEVVDALRAAVTAAATDIDRLYCLSDLCGALFIRYPHQDGRGDLDEAASIARDVAVSALPEPPPGVLLNLAHVLDQRARVAAVLDDLDAAITLVRRAAAAIATGGPSSSRRPRGYIQLRASDIWDDRTGRDEPGHAEVLRLLSAYLLRRFEWTDVPADIDEAIRTRRQVVAVTSGDDAEHTRGVMSLSYALKARFTRTGNGPDLDEALENGRRALAHDPGNALFLVSVSDTLRIRFEQLGAEPDLDEAIELARRATGLLPGDSDRRADAFANLSGLLRARFDLQPYSGDIGEAVDAARQAVLAAGDEDFDRPKLLLTLARALEVRIRDTGRRGSRGETDPGVDIEADRSEALRVLADLVGCATAAPRIRVEGAKMGAWLAVENRAPGTEELALAADLLESAVHLVPEIAPRRMRHHEQRHAIQSATGLADNAAALALLAPGRPAEQRAERALSLLEAGRAVLLSQLLDTRGDLTDLRQVRPDLATRFTALRELLDRDADPAIHEGGDRIGAAAELTATLREIQRLDGFATFALPPTADELRRAADQGPVVTFNVAYGGHALLLTKDDITALPLPALTAPAVIDQVNAFHVALREAYDPGADRVAAQGVLTEVLKWLWDNVTGPVLDALGYHGTLADDASLPRLWWAPGGYLSLLPLHAAGHHDTPASGRTVLDRVVSSYTPTIRSLRHARHRQAAANAAPNRSLIIAMPVTPGLSELRNVVTETELLTGILPSPHILTRPDRYQVLAELPRNRIAHFACHGSYDIENPANSRLLLHDHEQNPLSVGDLSAVNLDGAQLAYLSACHTAVNSADRLLDEAMHLAGALQAAGFPQVVGTLWELDDEVAVEITEDFYRGLRIPGTETLDPARAAYSLHRAIREQRDCYPGTPSLWASHMHFGS